LPDLAGARTIHLGMLATTESRTLFERILGADRADAEPDRTDAVLEVCAGLPLAIRIAASRLAVRPEWTVGMLAERLADQRRRLDELAVAIWASGRRSRSATTACRRKRPGCFRLLVWWTAEHRPAGGGRTGRSAADQVEPVLEALVDTHLLAWTATAATERTTCCGSTRPTGPPPTRPGRPGRPRSIGCSPGTCTPRHAAATVLNPNRSHTQVDHPDQSFADYAEALAWLTSSTRTWSCRVPGGPARRPDIAWKLPIELWTCSSCAACGRTSWRPTESASGPPPNWATPMRRRGC